MGHLVRPRPGPDRGVLWQQNSIRDAVLAGLKLNIFHAHAERVSRTVVRGALTYFIERGLIAGMKKFTLPRLAAACTIYPATARAYGVFLNARNS